jgi:glycosyltransferase involved in cell wall biosynthesis
MERFEGNVTLIIITRKRPEKLQELLDLIVGQTRLPDEVIVVENNDKRTLNKIIEKFKDTLPVKYILETEIGLGPARACGLKHANCDIVAFCDDDCKPYPEWIDMLTRPFGLDDKIGVVGGMIETSLKNGSLAERFSQMELMLNAN